MDIRKQVSHVFKPPYAIGPGRWRETFNKLQREGRVTIGEVIDIVIILLEREEQREQKDTTL